MSVHLPKPPTAVLVTGATGFFGSQIVDTLSRKGYRVRALVRKTSMADRVKKLNAEIYYGDMVDYASLDIAFADINIVIHAAADTRGESTENLRTTIKGTENIVLLAKKHKIDKLVYISSCSVYGVSELRQDQVVDETAPIERNPEKRGFYSEAKLKAEQLLVNTADKENVPFVCLRPGAIFGQGGDIYTPIMGFAVGNKLFAIIGNGNFVLPLVYIDNLVEAVVLVIQNNAAIGRTYNVVDSDCVTKKEFVDLFLRKLYKQANFVYIPYWIFYYLVCIQEIIMTKCIRKKPFLTRYRLISSQRSVVFDSSRIRKELNWKPSTALREAINRVLTYEMNRVKQRQSNK